MPPLFAVQLLTGSKSLNLRQAFGFVVLMAAGCVFSVLIAQIFVQTPFVLILVLSLLIFLAFLMLATGRAVPVANILLITVSVVPLVAISSIDLAYGLVYTLIAGSILAVLLVFLAYAFFPARDDTNELAKPPAEERFPVGAALANAAVLMSLVILFISSGSAVSVIVIMTAITVLRPAGDCRSRRRLRVYPGQCRGRSRRHRRISAGGIVPVTCLPLACRSVVRAHLWGKNRGRWRLGPDLHCRIGDLSDCARARPRPAARRQWDGLHHAGLQCHHRRHLYDRRRKRPAGAISSALACRSSCRRQLDDKGGSGGGTRTPDTRIMIPLL